MSLFKRYFNKKKYDAAHTVTWSEDMPSKGLFFKRFKKHKLAVIGFFYLAIILLAAIFAPLLAPYNPNEITDAFGEGPSMAHWLGTDDIGRDILSRVLYAARVVGPGLTNIILILGILGWPGIARLVRGNVLAIKQSDYVKAGMALGYSTPRILFKHILPNTIAPILIYATSGVAGAILDEAALSFLGLGVQPPDASWGNMLSSAQSITILTDQPWLWIPPGIFILLTVLSINYIGDALRDALDPRNVK